MRKGMLKYFLFDASNVPILGHRDCYFHKFTTQNKKKYGFVGNKSPASGKLPLHALTESLIHRSSKIGSLEEGP